MARSRRSAWLLSLAGGSLLAAPAAAACPSTPDDLLASAERALGAYEAMDDPAYAQAQRALRDEVECLGAPIRPAQAAAVHRLLGLDAFLAGDRVRATAAFRAALSLDPGWSPPAALFHADHPLRALLAEAASPAAGEAVALDRPARGGMLLVDGNPGHLVRPGQGAIVQELDASGAVVHSTWIGPGVTTPEWLSAPVAVGAPLPAPPPPAARPSPLPRVLAGAAGVAGLASGALYGYAWAEHAHFHSDTLTRDEVEPTAARVNGSLVASGAVGTVALACAVAAVLTVEW